MGDGKKTSLDMYSNLYKRYMIKRYKADAKDIENLLENMKTELLVCGYSSLLNAAYKSWYCFDKRQNILFYSYTPYNYTPYNYVLYTSGKMFELPVYDAYWLIIFLGEFLTTKNIPEGVQECTDYFFKNCALKIDNVNGIYTMLKTMDQEILRYRQEMYQLFMAEGKKESDTGVVSEAELDKEKQEIKKQEAELVYEEQEIQKDIIIENAHQQAKKILDEASAEAERKMTEAEKNVSALVRESRLNCFLQEQQEIMNQFAEVRTALMQANERMKCLEDSVSVRMTKKVYTQFLELYNLIADTKDSALLLVQQTDDRNLEKCAHSMDVFLDMITEYLADYGIRTLASSSRQPFSAKYQEAANKVMQFNPKTAIIKKSLRNGFVWDEQVLQKEKVEI